MNGNAGGPASPKALKLTVLGALTTGTVGILMAVFSVLVGREAGGAALLAAAALAFGLLALTLDRSGTRSSTSRVPNTPGSPEGQLSHATPSGHASSADGDGAEGMPLNVSHINGGLVIRAGHSDAALTDADPITEREREVLTLVAQGYSNKLISNSLGIAERTVKSHLTSTMTKLRASDRTHAVVTAVRLGWLDI